MRQARRQAAPIDTPELRQQLTHAGLRATPIRMTVLHHMLGAKQSLSHADLEVGLASHDFDRVTLYRTLDSFAEAGLLAKSIGTDRVARFVPIAQGDHRRHAHFSCDDCGRLFCLPAKPPRTSQLPAGFEVGSVELNVHGRCADCATQPPH